MISESQTLYGSARSPLRARQGRTRRWRSYHWSRRPGSGERSTFGAGALTARLMAHRLTEPAAVNKPARSNPKPLSQLVSKTIAELFARQGFASTGIVTHWPQIVGAEIADHAEPMRMAWPRR